MALRAAIRPHLQKGASGFGSKAVAVRFVTLLLALALFCAFAASVSSAQSQPQEVEFPSGGLQLHGFLWKPDGPGPFPAVLWNHGSEGSPGWQPVLGQFYTAHGYVFFIPHRRGQGRSPGTYIEAQMLGTPPAQRAAAQVELLEAQVDDVVAALRYLKAQGFVDPNRVALSGCSYGDIETLLAGERDLGVKALVPFAPGAMSWEGNPVLGDRLRRAVDRAKAPNFLIQAGNDYSLGPSNVWGPVSCARGRVRKRRCTRPMAARTPTATAGFVRPPSTCGAPTSSHFSRSRCRADPRCSQDILSLAAIPYRVAREKRESWELKP